MRYRVGGIFFRYVRGIARSLKSGYVCTYWKVCEHLRKNLRSHVIRNCWWPHWTPNDSIALVQLVGEAPCPTQAVSTLTCKAAVVCCYLPMIIFRAHARARACCYEVSGNQEGWKLNGTYEVVVYSDDDNILGGSIHTVRENTEALLVVGGRLV